MSRGRSRPCGRRKPDRAYLAVRLIERRPYVGLTRIEPDPRAGLPARFRSVDAVTLPLAGIGAAAVLAGRIEAATGLAVRFAGPPRRADETTGGDPPVHLLGAAGRDGLSPDGGIWTGPLDALLDAWTEPSGYEWRYVADRQAIEIVRSRSAVFHIHALAGTQRYTVSASTQDSAAGGDGGGSGGGNLTSQTISTETDYDPWPEIEGQLKGLLDPGTRLSVAPSSGSMTVSGTPARYRPRTSFPGLSEPRGAAARHPVGACLYGACRARGGLRSRPKLFDRPPTRRGAACQRGCPTQ